MGKSAILDGKKAIQNQSYGSESRGGECRGDVIISDDDIYELEPSQFDILVAMTQPAYEKFVRFLKPGGMLILEKDLVVPKKSIEPKKIKKYAISATDIAFQKFNKKIIANMVILGFLNKLSGLVSESVLEHAISENVPKGTEELNLNAMREGAKLAEKELASS
jgi:2-oxoglutarate ferredoxin oxidoreductase subunit gamma